MREGWKQELDRFQEVDVPLADIRQRVRANYNLQPVTLDNQRSARRTTSLVPLAAILVAALSISAAVASSRSEGGSGDVPVTLPKPEEICGAGHTLLYADIAPLMGASTALDAASSVLPSIGTDMSTVELARVATVSGPDGAGKYLVTVPSREGREAFRVVLTQSPDGEFVPEAAMLCQ